MSFGYSVGDAVLLTQVAWKTLQNTRKACGEHDELTREVLSLHIVLQRLEQEYSKTESPLNHSSDTYKEELRVIGRGCERVLGVLNTIVEKYNRLSEEERSWRKLWQKIRFGNGQVADLQDLRSKIVTYTSAMSLFLNMVSLGSVGRIEQQMTEAGGDLQEIKLAIHGIAAHLISNPNNEGSVLSSYTNDDKSVWKEFRRELRREGFASSDLKRNKTLIVAYIKELGDRGLFDDNDSGDLQSVEELEASNAFPATEDLQGENRPKSSSTDQPLLRAESTSPIHHTGPNVTESGRLLFLSSYEICNANSVSGNVPDPRLTMSSSKDDISEQCRVGTSRLTSVSEAPTLNAKGLEGTGIPLERKPLQPYAESVVDESAEELDDVEPSPLSQSTPTDIPCTVTPPTSHDGLSRNPKYSTQTNHSSTSSSTGDQESVTRTPPTESMEDKPAKRKCHTFGQWIHLTARNYIATNGFCLKWDDLDGSSVLNQFEDRVHILIDCQQIAQRFRGRLSQFERTAEAIISNINTFLETLRHTHGPYIRRSSLHGFTSHQFKVGILSLSQDGFGDFEDLRDILINVYLWVCRFDDNCGGIVFYYQDCLTSKNYTALQYPRNLGLRECWAMPNRLRSTTRSMEGTYQRPSYFSLDNEGPTSPDRLREFRYLAEENRLQSSAECRVQNCCKKPPQLSEWEGTEVSSDDSDEDTAPVFSDGGDFMRRWLQTSVQGPEDSRYYGGWCRDIDLNLQPWIRTWCAGNSWMAGLAVDAIWHNYHEKIALACIEWVQVRGNSADLEHFQYSIKRSLSLLSVAGDPSDEILRKDLCLMSQILEDVGEGRISKVLDMRRRERQGKRVWLSIEHENGSTVPTIKIHTGEDCAVCNTPTRNASNRAVAFGDYDTVPSS